MDNLQKQHVIVVDWCCLCKRNGESMDHLWLHCEVACAIWNVFFSRFGLSRVMPRRVVDLYARWWIASNTIVMRKRWCLSAFCGAYGKK
jgi:hypothetical protein